MARLIWRPCWQCCARSRGAWPSCMRTPSSTATSPHVRGPPLLLLLLTAEHASCLETQRNIRHASQVHDRAVPVQGNACLSPVHAYWRGSRRCYIVTGAAGLYLGVAGNVLLAGSPAAPNGFSAKVADFGMARCMLDRSRSPVSAYGTATHQAPETLEHGVISKVGPDVTNSSP